MQPQNQRLRAPVDPRADKVRSGIRRDTNGFNRFDRRSTIKSYQPCQATQVRLQSGVI
jgi:hypothetical protein